jgi:hypothetical protein
MDTPQSGANTSGYKMKHPLVWGFWTQEDPDTIHITDYAPDEDENRKFGEIMAMCGYDVPVWERPSSAQFILGNERLCAACLEAYKKYGASQAGVKGEQ